MRNSRVIIYTDLDSIALKDKAYSFSKRVNLKHCDRLSFYGKAKKATEGRYTALFSYDTLICVYDKAANTLHVGKYWNYSATTRRHEMSFLDDLFDNSMRAILKLHTMSMIGLERAKQKGQRYCLCPFCIYRV